MQAQNSRTVYTGNFGLHFAICNKVFYNCKKVIQECAAEGAGAAEAADAAEVAEAAEAAAETRY